MSKWKPVAGRITLFFGQQSQGLPSPLALYKQIWEGEPLNFQTATNPLGQSSAQGESRGFVTSCQINPVRIDFTVAPPQPPVQELPQLNLVEDSGALHDELSRIMKGIAKNWIPNPIIRVAAYVPLVAISKTWAEGNANIMSIVPKKYRIELGDEEEFVLHIVQKGASKVVKEVKLNYVTKWSVEQLQMMPIGVAANAPVVGELITASVAFDFNNIPTNAPLSHGDQSSLLLECLATIGVSFVECGIDTKGFAD